MARSTEDLQTALMELRKLPREISEAAPRIYPATPESLMAREFGKVHDFCGLLLDEVLELRGDQG